MTGGFCGTTRRWWLKEHVDTEASTWTVLLLKRTNTFGPEMWIWHVPLNWLGAHRLIDLKREARLFFFFHCSRSYTHTHTIYSNIHKKNSKDMWNMVLHLVVDSSSNWTWKRLEVGISRPGQVMASRFKGSTSTRWSVKPQRSTRTRRRDQNLAYDMVIYSISHKTIIGVMDGDGHHWSHHSIFFIFIGSGRTVFWFPLWWMTVPNIIYNGFTMAHVGVFEKWGIKRVGCKSSHNGNILRIIFVYIYMYNL